MTPFVNTAIGPQVRSIDGLSIRYAESEPREEHALLLSPWPESLFAFAPSWSTLAEHAHLIAVDLPGFGHSEGRGDLFSPRAMGEFVVRLADAFGLDQPHAVGPDVGTPALLFAAAAHRDRFRSLVVGAGATSYPLELGEPLAGWVGAPDLEPYRSQDPRRIVAAAMSTIAPTYPVPDQIRQDYLAAYDGERFVESMHYVRTYPAELPILRDVLADVQTPVLIVASERDRVVPPSNAHFLQARLPNSTLHLIDAGHFSWEDNAPEYARVLTAWWASQRAAA